jgi:hypothetical protein
MLSIFWHRALTAAIINYWYISDQLLMGNNASFRNTCYWSYIWPSTGRIIFWVYHGITFKLEICKIKMADFIRIFAETRCYKFFWISKCIEQLTNCFQYSVTNFYDNTDWPYLTCICIIPLEYRYQCTVI